MAQLSTLFSFIGLTAYLHGRIVSLHGESWRGYLWMSFSLVLATPLAVLSKENGILLPLLVLVIEFCLAAKLVALHMWWRTVFLYAPSLVVLWLLLREINFSKDAWPNRVFTQPERLLTEPRIIWEYLYYLWVPHVEGRGLFQDGYNFSRSLFNPISTVFSLVALIILVGAAAAYRNRYPLFSLGVFFFLAGHLLESTTIGLELYFEHRNYLPAAFLFLPVIVLIFDSKKVSRSLAVIIAIIVFALLSFFTWKRANLWANTEALQFYWAASTPESPRAQAKIVRRLMHAGRTDEGIERMENAVQLIPQSSLLTISLLIIKVHSYKASAIDFERTEKMMRSQSFDPQSVMGLRNLVEDVVTPDKLNLYGRNTLMLISELEKNSNFNKVHAFRRIAPYLKASLYMAFKEFDLAYKEYLNAIPLHHDADASLAMVAEMARANRPAEALQLLDVAYKEFEKQRDSTLVRSRESYNLDFQRLQSSLQADVQAMGGPPNEPVIYQQEK
jgi:tetratricopeptide (TPR) repeat protein